MKIVFLGAGNVAEAMAVACQERGFLIEQVYSRTMESAASLAKKVAAEAIVDLSCLSRDADVYLCALKDAVLERVLVAVPDFGTGLWLHTSGSMPMSVFEPYTKRHGVFYPLQTFSKGCPYDFSTIPLCVEASDASTMTCLKEWAARWTKVVVEMDSSTRRYLHLAAVFACNFPNYLYGVAADLLQQKGLPFDLLLPLIDETARKVHEKSPHEAQTGPAVRMDKNIIDKHLDLLAARPDMAQLYVLLSQGIYKRHSGVE